MDFTSLVKWFAGLLPGQCMVCGDRGMDALCPGCADRFWTHDAALARCLSCGIRLVKQASNLDRDTQDERGGRGNHGTRQDETKSADDRASWKHPICGHCAHSPPAFDATIALADYRPPLDVLAIGFKFHGRPALAAMLAKRLARHALDHGVGSARSRQPTRHRLDLLIPVPLSARRLAARGYNQAWELTRRVGRQITVPARATLLLRTHSAAQSALGMASRQRNMRASVSVNPAQRHLLPGAHVGVVDDVMTTGATFDATARVLKEAGAARVTNLVLFRTA